jgi:hypothetical protein
MSTNKRGRDAETGRFVTIDQAKKNPKTTVIETVKGPAKRKKGK